MHRTNLRGLDLNLLVILKVLLDECNTTRAAEQLAMSQPAVSRALARLRIMYDDPLLVRTPQGMEPTAKALLLRQPLREILQSVEHTLLPPAPPEPNDFTGTLRIGAHTYMEYVILPGLIERLHQEAPRLTLHIMPLGADYESLLDEGTVSMVITKQDRVPERFEQRHLLEDRLICVASRDHPYAGRSIDYEAFARADHLLVAPRGSEGGVLDEILLKEGLTRHTQLIVQSFLSAPFILSGSGLLLTSPARVLAPLMAPLGLTEIETAFSLPRFTISQIRHRRDEGDALLDWFSGRLRRWCAELLTV
ncbi:LysR family transcriptional regulator [Aeromonas diversa]|uniref:LysR family transcriptional regulator n=1 Tax=Aeromonas diversa TaxID=502790 RepID=UPI00346380F3